MDNKAAILGDTAAMYAIGTMLRKAKVSRKIYRQAMTWYRKAADQGEVLSQSSIGEMYRDGRGVPQDYVQAYMWYDRAAANENTPQKNPDNAYDVMGLLSRIPATTSPRE